MSRLQLRVRLGRAARAFVGEDDATHLLHGRLLRAIIRSRGGMVVFPQSCWGTGSEPLAFEAVDLGPGGMAFVIRLQDRSQIRGSQDPATRLGGAP